MIHRHTDVLHCGDTARGIKDLLYPSLWQRNLISLLENVLYGAAVTNETCCHCLSTISASSYFFHFILFLKTAHVSISIYLDCRILLNIASLIAVSLFEGINHKAAEGGLFPECAALNGNISHTQKNYSCYPGIPQWV